jgi:hypothetical protein
LVHRGRQRPPEWSADACVTRHGYLGSDEFTADEVHVIGEWLGFSRCDIELVLHGVDLEACDILLLGDMPPWEAEQAQDEWVRDKETRYGELVAQLIEIRAEEEREA